MSSPSVSTFQPGDRRLQHGQVGLAARRRERRRDVVDLLRRRGQLEDQHVLGEPALVPRLHRGDPQRVALLAEQRVAAVAGAVATRSPAPRGSARCTWSRCTARRRRSRPGRAAHRHSAGRARSPRRRRARSRALDPIRVMMCIEATTYGESVSSTPNIGDSASSGPMQYGMTYMVRPRMQPAYSSVMIAFMSAGAIQLFVAPASALVDRADERAVLHPGHVARVRGAPERVRLLRRVEPHGTCPPRPGGR